MFKVNKRKTRTNCKTCLMFIRTALENIITSQLVLGVQFGTLNLCFQTGLQSDVIQIFLLSKYLYISFFFWFYRDCPVGSFKYPGNIYLFKLKNKHPRTRSKMYSTLVIKTIEQRQSRRSTIFIVNFEHIRHLVLVFPFLTWKR